MSDAIRRELAAARARDRVHGAYLFEGEHGTPLRETAIWFARLLLCLEAGDEPCGACRGCKATAPIEEDEPASHADLALVEPDGQFIKVEQVRALQRELSLVPVEGGRRAALLMEADRMRLEAANALLKTLEEPPRDATLILVAERGAALPLTIRSRATRIHFAPDARESIATALAEGGLDPDDAWLAAALGGASNASAEDWAEENLEEAREMRDLVGSAAERSDSDLLDFAGSFRGGVAVRARTELFLSVHDAVARREVESAIEQDRIVEARRWLDRLDASETARNELIRRNLNPQLLVEGLLLALR